MPDSDLPVLSRAPLEVLERDAEQVAIVRDFFARVCGSDQVFADVRRVMRGLHQSGNDLLVLHHSLGVPLERAAEWLGLPQTVAFQSLAAAEAAVAPLIPR